ncbi:MAG: excinuclease ABC subunit UvrB [Candidatus Gracilibacteria bacterium]
MQKFELVSKYKPAGSQPDAIELIIKNINNKVEAQTLLGITGSGKTFTMANVIVDQQRPTLIIAHNKTLAAQLAAEFKEFFPNNAVHYFVSYYDYYQPEAYVAKTDTFIEKDAAINEEIEKFRHAATVSLLTRRDVIIVASVSCIYGIGDIKDYEALSFELEVGAHYQRDELLKQFVSLQYKRSKIEFKRGMFHVLGDLVELFPPNSDTIYRMEFFDDELERMYETDPITGEIFQEFKTLRIFPANHYATPPSRVEEIIPLIKEELEMQVKNFQDQGKIMEAARIRQRTEYDIEMLKEMGFTQGIENYSRYLSGREPGSAATTLIDYFPKDFLTFVDESHITIPQIGGMYNGDRARKENLVNYGFRLPSALDNRPLKFNEFEERIRQHVFVSATPGKYEKLVAPDFVIEQIIRPTGLLDPEIEVKPTKGMVDDLLIEIRKVIAKNEKVLVTTLTKRNAEDLTDYFQEQDFKVKYLHSDIDTIERIEILRELRTGVIDIIVGINLLREGLDLPEVSLVTIIDADKEGFLRSESALMQTIGRAARNSNGRVIMYADKMTGAMNAAIAETNRRRILQIEYNKEHGMTPKTVISSIKDIGLEGKKKKFEIPNKLSSKEKKRLMAKLELEMDFHAANLEFEKAAELRDQIETLKSL